MDFWSLFSILFFIAQALFFIAQNILFIPSKNHRFNVQLNDECEFLNQGFQGEMEEDIASPTKPSQYSSPTKSPEKRFVLIEGLATISTNVTIVDDFLSTTKIEDLGKDIFEIKQQINKRRTKYSCTDPISSYQPEENSLSQFMQLGICAPIFQEELFLREWVSFHLLMGFSNFVLYTMDDPSNVTAILKPLEGNFEVLFFPSEFNLTAHQIHNIARQGLTEKALGPQYMHHCSKKMQEHGVEWVAFMNVDEFMYPINFHRTPTVIESLALHKDELNDFLCIPATRLLFGSELKNGRPPGSVLSSYFLRQDRNSSETAASLINLARAKTDSNILCEEELPAPFLRINRYLRSLEDLNIKMWAGLKSAAQAFQNTQLYANGFFQFVEQDHNDIYDDSALYYFCAMKSRLGEQHLASAAYRIKDDKKGRGRSRSRTRKGKPS